MPLATKTVFTSNPLVIILLISSVPEMLFWCNFCLAGSNLFETNNFIEFGFFFGVRGSLNIVNSITTYLYKKTCGNFHCEMRMTSRICVYVIRRSQTRALTDLDSGSLFALPDETFRLIPTSHSCGNTSYPAFALSWVCLATPPRDKDSWWLMQQMQPFALPNGSCMCHGKSQLTARQFVTEFGSPVYFSGRAPPTTT